MKTREPATTPEAPATLQRRIGGTTYNVGIFFNPGAKETLDGKVRRLLKNDLQKACGGANIKALQAGWLPEGVQDEQKAAC